MKQKPALPDGISQSRGQRKQRSFPFGSGRHQRASWAGETIALESTLRSVECLARSEPASSEAGAPARRLEQLAAEDERRRLDRNRTGQRGNPELRQGS